MKKIVILIIVLLGALTSQADERPGNKKHESVSENPVAGETKASFKFVASSELESVKGITQTQAGNHFLGTAIAKKMYLYNTRYSYKEPVAPGNSATKTIFRKPEIYTSIKKIERYLKKCTKEGSMQTDEAGQQYETVLNVALNILDINTSTFEDRLKAAGNDAPELLEIYLHEVVLQYIN